MTLTVVFIVLALGAGLAGGYFFYRIRHNRELGLFEARETALLHRKAEFERIHSVHPEVESVSPRQLTTLESTVQMLREELEERSMEIGFLKEEHRLEQKVLLHEIESLKAGKGRAKGFRYEIEDVQFESHRSQVDEDDVDVDRFQKDKTDRPENAGPGSLGDEQRVSSEDTASDENATSSESPEEKAASSHERTTRTTTDWASDVVSYLFTDLISAFSDAPPGPRQDSTVEALNNFDHDAGPDTGIPSIPYPKFKTLYELRLFDKLGNHVSEGNGVNGRPAPAEQAGLQLLLGLSDSDFDALQEMGYATYERVAQLSDSEIEILSVRFGVPSSRIVSIWISGAQLRLHQNA